MELTVEAVEMMAKRIRTARAAQDHAAIDDLTVEYAAMGAQLHQALHRYGDRIVEAACCNNAQRLRELHDGLRALREVLIEWRLVAEELGVFSTASANGSVSGGDGCCCPSPVAASFTSEEASDA
jgi:anti-sigma factor RsiW